MKRKQKRILGYLLIVSVFCSSFIPGVNVALHAQTTIENKDLVREDMEWTYLDKDIEVAVRNQAVISGGGEQGVLTGATEISGDPNAYTWFSRWNKRNGWAYPSDFLDHGVINMDFSDSKWSTAPGTSFSSNDQFSADTSLANNDDGTTRKAYFFRYTFQLDDPKEIYAIAGNVKYKDAMIMYVNGKAVESLFNIPISNYSKNLEYGSSTTLTEPKSEDFLIQDVSSLRTGENTIAVEIHASDANSAAYFALNSFVLNPSEDTLPESPAVKAIALNTGADETQRNVAWYSLSNHNGTIQIMEGSNVADFAEGSATTFDASEPVLAYTKFVDTNYYSNKATIQNIEPGKNYLYRVGNADGYSEVYVLKTQDITSGYDAIFLSDPQIGTGTIPTDEYGWKQTLNNAFTKNPNASILINTGDFVDVATKEGEYDAYFEPDELKSYASATAVGNHDISANYGFHFNEPNASTYGKNVANSDYYYVYGKVLYIVLNTSFANNQEHIDYMKKVVEDTKDLDIDWKVLMFHQSVYSGGTQSLIEDNIKRREELIPTIDALGIDLALMGHDHGYVRTHQMKGLEVQTSGEVVDGYEVNPKGTLYLTSSSASGSKYYGAVSNPEVKEYISASQFSKPTYSVLSFKDKQFEVNTYAMNADGSSALVDTYGMEKDIDASALSEAIAQAQAMDLSTYTSESAKAYLEAIQSARTVAQDKNTRQSFVDGALEALLNAKMLLVKQETTLLQQTLIDASQQIKVSGVLPEGVTLNVTRMSDPISDAGYSIMSQDEHFGYYATRYGYIITLMYQGKEYQPTLPVALEIQKDVDIVSDATGANVWIGHVHGENVDFIKPILKDGYYKISISNFSSFFVNQEMFEIPEKPVTPTLPTTPGDGNVPNKPEDAKVENVPTNDNTQKMLYVALAFVASAIVLRFKLKRD